MAQVTIYNTLRWRAARSRALSRDGNRCSIARLFGGTCSASLDVHHLHPVREGGAHYDLDNLLTCCDSHHPMLEAFRRGLLARAAPCDPVPPRCRHHHRTEEARRLCELRLRNTVSVG